MINACQEYLKIVKNQESQIKEDDRKIQDLLRMNKFREPVAELKVKYFAVWYLYISKNKRRS